MRFSSIIFKASKKCINIVKLVRKTLDYYTKVSSLIYLK